VIIKLVNQKWIFNGYIAGAVHTFQRVHHAIGGDSQK